MYYIVKFKWIRISVTIGSAPKKWDYSFENEENSLPPQFEIDEMAKMKSDIFWLLMLFC